MMPIMKKWPLFTGRIVLAGGIALLANSCASQNRTRLEATYRLQSKSDPARLEHFNLPDSIDVRTLGAGAALEKLRVSYTEICRKNGEKPHDLAFEVPAGHDAPLGIKLSKGNLDSSVRRVAAVAKLELVRDGTTYRLKEPKETGKLVKRSLRVPPDFAYRFGESGNTKLATSICANPRIGFERFGIELEESTKLSFSRKTYELTMETRSAADEVAIATALSCEGLPVQQMIDTKVFEIAPGSDWKGPRAGSFDAKTADRMLADLSQRKDVKASEMPTVTSRVGETVSIDSEGRVLRVKTGLLGTGHEVQTNFTDTSKGKHTELHDSGYASDMGTRFTVKSRPDGSRVVFAVTPTLIDATGRPVYPAGK